MKKLTKCFAAMLAVATVFSSCDEDDTTNPVADVVTVSLADLAGFSIDENSPKGTEVGNISVNVSNTNLNPTLTILSQSPEGAVSIVDGKLVIADSTVFDYETNTEVTGEIEASVGEIKKSANFKIIINDIEEDRFIIFNDDTFKSLLVADDSINTDGDEEIKISEANAFDGTIAFPNKGIKDITGIEYFVNLDRLQLFGNQISSVDVSKNTKLTQLLLESNDLEVLDVSALSLLTDLKAHSNDLLTVNLQNGNNANITRVHLHNNDNLTCILVDNLDTKPKDWVKEDHAFYNTSCDYSPINFEDDKFKSLLLADSTINLNGDEEISIMEAHAFKGTIATPQAGIKNVIGIEHFVNLDRLQLFGNQISSIDVSKNTKLTQLLLESNDLVSIDVSALTLLEDFKAHSNDLTSVNLQNGNNSIITRVHLHNNDNLTCILVDNLDAKPEGWVKDDEAEYKTECE